MKSLIRVSLALIVALVLAIGAAPGLSARAADTCFGLNEADCALANSANSADSLKKLTAFNVDYTISVASSTDSAADAKSTTIHGSGPISVGNNMAAMMQATEAATTPDAAATAPATEAARADMKLPADFKVGQTLTVTQTDSKGTITNNIELRIVDGVIYVKDDKSTQGAWKRFDPKDLAKMHMTELPGMGGKGGMGGLLNLFGGRNGRGSSLMGIISALQSAGKLAQTPGVITAKRGADQTIDTQTVATFVYSVDLVALFNSPAIGSLIGGMFGGRGGNGGDNSSPATPSAIMQNIQKGLVAAFQGTTITITRLVGTTDHLPYGLGIDVAAKIDPSVMMPLAGGGTPTDSTMKKTSTDFHFLVKLSGIGTPVSVSAPANSTPLDLSTLMPPATAAPTMAATAAQ